MHSKHTLRNQPNNEIYNRGEAIYHVDIFRIQRQNISTLASSVKDRGYISTPLSIPAPINDRVKKNQYASQKIFSENHPKMY